MQNHERLSVEEFGKILIESGDLDPVYQALHTLLSSDVLSQEQLNRWVLAYSCLYHCGVASYLSEFEGDAFFAALMVAAKNEEPSPLNDRWPRAKERRHWRGDQAVRSCRELWDRYGKAPEDFLEYVAWGDDGAKHRAMADRVGVATLGTTCGAISARVREHRGFGSWISFKLADMIDRIGLRQVVFNYEDVTIYRDPIISAEQIVRRKHGYGENVYVKPEAVKAVFTYLEKYFADYAAPPLGDRPIGLPEVETLLCKFKSFCNSHYPLYNDIIEIREGLRPWTEVSEVAGYFLASMPKVPAEVAAEEQALQRITA